MNDGIGVEVRRGGLLESVHAVDVAVCDPAGRLVAWFGEPHRPTFLRSAAKPLQAYAAWRCGIGRFGIAPHSPELAVMSASHGATDAQREAVFSVLRAGGLDESHLQCGAHEPFSAEGKAYVAGHGGVPTPVCGNCSGKHAGQLLACLARDWPTASYRSLDHPLTAHVQATLALVAGCDEAAVELAVDGCGLPTPVMPLSAAATAFARLLGGPPAAGEPPLSDVGLAMRSHPELVGAPDSFNVALMLAMPAITAKSGAEACFCGVIDEPRLGFAVKVLDGNQRAVPPVVMAVLRQLGVAGDDALPEQSRPPISNLHGEPVGWLESVLELRR